MNENFVHRSSSALTSWEERTPRYRFCKPLHSGHWRLAEHRTPSSRSLKASINVRYAYEHCLLTPSSNPDAVPEVHTSFPVDGCRPCWPTMLSREEMLQRSSQRHTRSFRSSFATHHCLFAVYEQPMPPFLNRGSIPKRMRLKPPAACIHCQS